MSFYLLQIGYDPGSLVLTSTSTNLRGVLWNFIEKILHIHSNSKIVSTVIRCIY